MSKPCNFYPTQPPAPSPTKLAFQHFTKKLQHQLNRHMILKKKDIIRQTTQQRQHLANIHAKAQGIKQKIYQRDELFKQKFERPIKKDIGRWEEYQQFFRGEFVRLEEMAREHARKNQEYRQRIKEKKKVLYAKMRLQRDQGTGNQASCPVLKTQNTTSRNTSSKLQKQNPSTKQSTVRMSYSVSMVPSRNRVQTQSSLPSLKPSFRSDRIKTIHTQYNQQGIPQLTNRNPNYMQPIGTIKKQQQSMFPLLIQLMKWYRVRVGEGDYFMKIVMQERNFMRLMGYLQSHSGSRKVYRRKTDVSKQ